MLADRKVQASFKNREEMDEMTVVGGFPVVCRSPSSLDLIGRRGGISCVWHLCRIRYRGLNPSKGSISNRRAMCSVDKRYNSVVHQFDVIKQVMVK